MLNDRKYHLQKVDNSLKYMCETVRVYCHPADQGSLVITDELDGIETELISGIITTSQLIFKEIDGQIHNLTQEVFTVHPILR